MGAWEHAVSVASAKAMRRIVVAIIVCAPPQDIAPSRGAPYRDPNAKVAWNLSFAAGRGPGCDSDSNNTSLLPGHAPILFRHANLAKGQRWLRHGRDERFSAGGRGGQKVADRVQSAFSRRRVG